MAGPQQIAQQKSRPSQVSSPVPNETATSNVDSLMAEMAAFEMPSVDTEAAPQKGIIDTAKDIGGMVSDAVAPDIAQLTSTQSPDPLMNEMANFTPTDELPIEEDPGFFQSNFTPSGIRDQVELAPYRLQAAFGKTNKEKLMGLKAKLGDDNVREDGDDILVKLPGKKSFKKLDPGTIEIIGDVFADEFRNSTIAMGGVAGAVAAGGPSAGAAAPIGFAAGAAMGDQVADAIAEQWLGIPRDEARGGVAGNEAPIGEQLKAGLQRSLGSIQTGMEFAIFNKVAEKAIGYASNRLGKLFKRHDAIKRASEIPAADRLDDTVKGNLETVKELQNLNVIENLPGTDLPLLAHQMLPGTDATMVARSVQTNKGFQSLQDQASKQLGDAVLDMVETSAGLSKDSLKGAVKTGTTQTRSGLVDDVGTTLANAIKREGEIIGKFRDKAKATAKTAALPSPKTTEALKNIFSEIGVTRRKGELIFPDDDSMAQFLGTDSKAIINGFKKDLIGLNNKLATQGGLTIDDLIGQSQIIGAKNKAAGRIGGVYKNFIGKLSSNLRDDTREAMPYVLDEVETAAYKAATKDFGQLASARDQLGKLLESETGANTFARLLLSKGKNGLSDLRAAKAFLLKENPTAWKNVAGQFFEDLAVKHRTPGDASQIKYNVAGMRKELASYGDEFLQELLPDQKGVNVGTILRAFDLADQVQNAVIKGTDEEVVKASKAGVKAFAGFADGKINLVMSMLRFGGSNNRLAKLISQRGVEEFLEQVPPKQRGELRKTLEGAMTWAQNNGHLQSLKNGVYAPAKASAKFSVGSGIKVRGAESVGGIAEALSGVASGLTQKDIKE